MFVNATIVAEHRKVWALPTQAVLTQGEQTFCYRVEDGKAVRTPIQVGLQGNEKDNELIEVLRINKQSGKAGSTAAWQDWSGEEVIVATEASSLTEGQSVSVSAQTK